MSLGQVDPSRGRIASQPQLSAVDSLSAAPNKDPWIKQFGPMLGTAAAIAGVGAGAYGAYRLRKLARHPLGIALAVGGAALLVSGGGVAAASSRVEPSQQNEPDRVWNLRLGQLNLKNLFDLVDQEGKQDDVPTPQAHELHLSKLALTIRDVMVTPDVISVEEAENLEALEELASRPELKEFNYQPLIIEGRDPRGIDNAFLYRADRVTPSDIKQLDPKAESVSGRQTPVYTRPPLLASFVPTEAPDATPVTVAVNHFTSKLQGVDGEARRLQQAEHLAAYVDAQLGADSASRIAVIGDLNDGPQTPPLQLLTGPSNAIDGARLIATTDDVEAEERYSYRNGSKKDLLDHVLITPGLDEHRTGVWIPHSNTVSTAPDRRDPTTPVGASDHDPVIVDFALPV